MALGEAWVGVDSDRRFPLRPQRVFRSAHTSRSNDASRDYCEQAETLPWPIRPRLDSPLVTYAKNPENTPKEKHYPTSGIVLGLTAVEGAATGTNQDGD